MTTLEQSLKQRCNNVTKFCLCRSVPVCCLWRRIVRPKWNGKYNLQSLQSTKRRSVTWSRYLVYINRLNFPSSWSSCPIYVKHYWHWLFLNKVEIKFKIKHIWFEIRKNNPNQEISLKILKVYNIDLKIIPRYMYKVLDTE